MARMGARLSPSILLLGLSTFAAAIQELATDTWNANNEDGDKPVSMQAAQPDGEIIDKSDWTATCDSVHSASMACDYAIDGDNSTYWHTDYNSKADTAPGFPHTITVDMKTSQVINGIGQLPRQDGSNHGWIARHEIYVSTDGKNFGDPVAFGSWYNDKTLKTSLFEPVQARYVRVTALSESSGTNWTSIAELFVYNSNLDQSTGQGHWGVTLDFPIIPVQAALDPRGKVVVWSAYKYDRYNGGSGYTLTSEWDMNTNVISERKISNTDHDMFCPGISMDGDGQLVVTGGNDANRTSLFDPDTDDWIKGPTMNIARGYQASTTNSEGKVFTIGGSWSGKEKVKNGEIYDPAAKTWTLLDGADGSVMLTQDPQGIYRADNHAWLFGWKNQTVYQAGPSVQTNWYYTDGDGDVKSAGNRTGKNGAQAGDQMCGNPVMFDATKGKIFAAGGSPAYQDADSTTDAYVMTIGEPGEKVVSKYASNGMYNARIFANSVVMPNGNIFITGGQGYGVPFEDSTPVLQPEIYNPSKDKFFLQRSNSIIRVYHSVALLLPDGTIFSGGGGLCGACTTNHFDAQIFTPQYLLNSDGSMKTRPVISSVGADTMAVGDTLTFKTGGAIASACLIRYGSSTHALNTDQRRIPLVIKSTGTNAYSAALPTDAGIMIPGYYLFFVLKNGVPSVAATVKITL